MIIEHKTSDFKKYLQVFCDVLKIKPQGDYVFLNEKKGNGFIYADIFTNGISIMISDLELKEEIIISRNIQNNTLFFILFFNESSSLTKVENRNEQAEDIINLDSSFTILASSFKPQKSVLPANLRVKSFAILFTKQAIQSLFGTKITDKFITGYFSSFLKKDFAYPLTAENRSILKESVENIIDHPLNKAFIENRAMLLLEKFMISLILKLQFEQVSTILKDEIIKRLIIAESMLIKDFSKSPPTIDMLSKACAMSPTKFKNDFKALYGLPVFEYYQKNRIQYARHLLKNDNYSIKEVGIMVGYSNLGHFAAAFKKEFNVLPGEMKKSNKLSVYNLEEEQKLVM